MVLSDKTCGANEGGRNFHYQRNVPEAVSEGTDKTYLLLIVRIDQFEVARPLLQEKHELIGKSYSVLLLSLPT